MQITTGSRHATQVCAMCGRDKSTQPCPPCWRRSYGHHTPFAAYRDGTTYIVMSPLEWLQRLAALVPRPRMHLIRYHGVLAPNAKWRSHIVPEVPIPDGTSADSAGEKEKGGRHYIHWPRSTYMCYAALGHPVRWARLLKRVFGIDLESCPKCGGTLKIIAAIEQPNAMQKILTHLGLQAHPPPRAPARYDPEREADLYQTPAMLHASVH